MALLARGFSSSSWALGRMGLRGTSFTSGFLPHTHTGNEGGQSQPLAAAASSLFTMRSSKEWKEMTASRPPAFSRGMAPCSIREMAVSSSFTAMRMP